MAIAYRCLAERARCAWACRLFWFRSRCLSEIVLVRPDSSSECWLREKCENCGSLSASGSRRQPVIHHGAHCVRTWPHKFAINCAGGGGGGVVSWTILMSDQIVKLGVFFEAYQVEELSSECDMVVDRSCQEDWMEKKTWPWP